MTYLAPRMIVEVPFAIFAVLVPFIATGPRTEVLGVSVDNQTSHRKFISKYDLPFTLLADTDKTSIPAPPLEKKAHS